MTDNTPHSHLTSYFFIILLFIGAGLFVLSFFTENQRDFFSGLQQIALGVFSIGVGEWINHPLQKSLAYSDKKDMIFDKIRHRNRNPSSLGNLLAICGLILIFTGLADFF